MLKSADSLVREISSGSSLSFSFPHLTRPHESRNDPQGYLVGVMTTGAT